MIQKQSYTITLLMMITLPALFACTSYAQQKPSSLLPQGFVYLAAIDPSIKQSVRYHSNHNFLGRRVKGYQRAVIIMTEQAAHALQRVQEELRPLGYSLLVYDAYRPQTAVNDFIAWSEDIADQPMKKQYYPDVDKARVFELGYVAKKSGHSRGSTVDLTLIKRDAKVRKGMSIREQERTLTDGSTIIFLDDNSLDMGSSFDLLGRYSHPDTTAPVTAEHHKNRELLRDLMVKHGFKQSTCEWWHYTLRNEPFPDTYFDFMIA